MVVWHIVVRRLLTFTGNVVVFHPASAGPDGMDGQNVDSILQKGTD